MEAKSKIKDMERKGITIYNDGASTRLHNRRMMFKETEGSVLLNFRFADDEADKPSCSHNCLKGKVRETSLKLSTEAMEYLVFTYIEFKKSKSAINKIK